MKINKYIKARAHFQESLEVNPNFRKGDILEYIGDSVFKNEKEDLSKALLFYQQASEYNPTNSKLYGKQGKWHEKMKNYPKAIDLYNKSVIANQDKSAIPLFRLAWAYIRDNKFEKGIEKLRAALQIDPDNAEILHKLGETLIRVEDDTLLNEAKEVIK